MPTGIYRRTIINKIAASSWDRSSRRVLDVYISDLLTRYKSGVSARELSREYGVSPTTVIESLRRCGHLTRTVAESNKEFSPEHKAKLSIAAKKNRGVTPEQARINKALKSEYRRLRIRCNGIKLITSKDIMKMLLRQNGQCYLCGDTITLSILEIDHIVPVSRGGRHSVGNIALACGPCNRKKRSYFLSEVRHGRCNSNCGS